jgi:uncharacterized protein with HEPN domain
MREDDRVRLQHMADAAQSISRFISGRERTDLDSDEMLLFAVVRAIEIIGDAAVRVSDETRRTAADIPWRDIVGMRNRIVPRVLVLGRQAGGLQSRRLGSGAVAHDLGFANRRGGGEAPATRRRQGRCLRRPSVSRRPWIAYTSNESGTYQVHVQALVRDGAKKQVSANGGYQPRWRRDGREIVYLDPTRILRAVTVKPTGQAADFGAPAELFKMPVPELLNALNVSWYAPAADGQRFLVDTQIRERTQAITLILNWSRQFQP